MKKCSSQKSILLFILAFLAAIGFVLPAPINAQNHLSPVPTPNPNPSEISHTNNEKVDTRSWTRYEFKEQIGKTAQKYGLDPQLIYATIMTESMGNVYAYRFEPRLNQGTYCLGQLLISTARRLGFTGSPEDLFNPEICIDLIGQYHKKNIDVFGELTTEQLVFAYNTGSPYKKSNKAHLSRFNQWFYQES